MVPSSAKVRGARSYSAPAAIHTSNIGPMFRYTWRSTDPGTRKMPEPMTVPMTISVRSRRLRTRARFTGPSYGWFIVNVVLFGATGMVGQGVLRECLRDAEVARVLAVGRSPIGQRHGKLRELLVKSFSDFPTVEAE